MISKRLSLLLIALVGYNMLFAQIVQKGVTLEYNRRNAKTPYNKLVSIQVSGSNSTVSENSHFTLNFNTRKEGDVVSIDNGNVSATDKNYVLYNGQDIYNWTLTSKRPLELVFCSKSIIDDVIARYTQSQMNAARKQFEQASKRLRETTKEVATLKKEMDELKKQYARDTSEIRNNAIIFAYVDESRLDSLEYEWHMQVLNGENEKAYQTAEKMQLRQLAEKRIINTNTALEAVYRNVEKEFNTAFILYQHAKDCGSNQYSWSVDTVLTNYYMSVIKIYDHLYSVYTGDNGLRCSDSHLALIKKLYANALYDYWDKQRLGNSLSLESAADMGHFMAMRFLTDSCWVDVSKSQSYRKRLYEILNGDEVDEYRNCLSVYFSCPTDEYISYEANEFQELYESYPDFYLVEKKDTFFYHILSSNEVGLVHFIHGNMEQKKIVVPASVCYNGNVYKVTKIGMEAFKDSVKIRKGVTLTGYNSACNLGLIDEIVLPEGIEHIGADAFYKLNGKLHVNLPKSLKSIGNRALNGCDFGGKVKIPEGVERIGYVEEPGVYYLPSSIKNLDELYDYDNVNFYAIHENVDLRLSPKSKHFVRIGDFIYSADTSKVYLGSHYCQKGSASTIFVSKKMGKEFLDQLYNNINTVSSLTFKFDIDPENEFFSTDDGYELYSKDKIIMYANFSSGMIVVPENFRSVEVGMLGNRLNDVDVTNVREPEGIINIIDTAHVKTLKYKDIYMHFEDRDREALQFLDSCIYAYPDDRVLYCTSILLALKYKDLIKAKNDITRMKEKFPEDSFAIVYSDSISKYFKLLSDLSNKGDSLHKIGKDDEAAEYYEQMYPYFLYFLYYDIDDKRMEYFGSVCSILQDVYLKKAQNVDEGYFSTAEFYGREAAQYYENLYKSNEKYGDTLANLYSLNYRCRIKTNYQPNEYLQEKYGQYPKIFETHENLKILYNWLKNKSSED